MIHPPNPSPKRASPVAAGLVGTFPQSLRWSNGGFVFKGIWCPEKNARDSQMLFVGLVGLLPKKAISTIYAGRDFISSVNPSLPPILRQIGLNFLFVFFSFLEAFATLGRKPTKNSRTPSPQKNRPNGYIGMNCFFLEVFATLGRKPKKLQKTKQKQKTARPNRYIGLNFCFFWLSRCFCYFGPFGQKTKKTREPPPKRKNARPNGCIGLNFLFFWFSQSVCYFGFPSHT